MDAVTLLVSAEVIVTVDDEEKSVGDDGLEEEDARFSAPLESILMGESCFLGGDNLLLLLFGPFLAKDGVMETMGAGGGGREDDDDVALLLSSASATLESCNTLSLFCHSRA